MTLFAAGDHAGTAGISTPTPRTWIDCHGAMERTQAQTQTRQPRTCRGHSTHFWMRPTEPDVWPDESFKRAQKPPLSPSNQPLFCLLVRAAESARSETPPPPRQPLPFRELPPRRKVVWIWICCCCRHEGMKVSVDPCPHCGIPRCPNCNTQRLHIRGGSNGLPAPEDEEDFLD